MRSTREIGFDEIKVLCDMAQPILVTGAAGFIGFHTAMRLLEQGRHVVGIDNLNDYYDVALKKSRLALLEKFEAFTFVKTDISDKKAMEDLWSLHGDFIEVVHLAAQAGVRYSLENPYSYIASNCMGHLTVMEMCRHTKGFKHLVYASSSSVYGGNTKLPYSVDDAVDQPLSLYAATKRSDELMSHTYSHLYNMPQTGFKDIDKNRKRIISNIENYLFSQRETYFQSEDFKKLKSEFENNRRS